MDMKKLLALVLVLFLALTAVSALAGGSKEVPSTGGTGAVEEGETFTIKFVDDTPVSKATIEKFQEAYNSGDVLAPLPADISSAIPAGFTKMNELLTAQIEGYKSGETDTVTINVMFETPYYDGTEVMVLIGILPADQTQEDAEIEWSAYKGYGQEDGSVNVTIPVEVFDKINTNPFLIGVISAQ